MARDTDRFPRFASRAASEQPATGLPGSASRVRRIPRTPGEGSPCVC